MDEIIRDDLPRCTAHAECFANQKGRCVALKYVTDAVCPFFKTKQQAADSRHKAEKRLWDIGREDLIEKYGGEI